MSDQLVKALALDGKVRIYAITTTDLTELARQKHDMWATSTAALGRTMAAALMMAGNLKSEKEKYQLLINGGGQIGTVLVEAKGNGDVRGFVGDSHVYMSYNDTNKLAVGAAVGKDGYLKVTRDLGRNDVEDSKVSGTVELISGEIAEDVAYYFAQSEQTPSLVSLGVLVDTDNSVLAAGGLIIQMMPDASEEDITYVEEHTKDLQPVSSLINSGKTAKDLITDIFSDAKILTTSPVQFKCDCSELRFKGALTTLAESELQAMIDEDDGCECRCEFCGSTYQFSASDLQFIIDFKRSCGR